MTKKRRRIRLVDWDYWAGLLTFFVVLFLMLYFLKTMMLVAIVLLCFFILFNVCKRRR